MKLACTMNCVQKGGYVSLPNVGPPVRPWLSEEYNRNATTSR